LVTTVIPPHPLKPNPRPKLLLLHPHGLFQDQPQLEETTLDPTGVEGTLTEVEGDVVVPLQDNKGMMDLGIPLRFLDLGILRGLKLQVDLMGSVSTPPSELITDPTVTPEQPMINPESLVVTLLPEKGVEVDVVEEVPRPPPEVVKGGFTRGGVVVYQTVKRRLI